MLICRVDSSSDRKSRDPNDSPMIIWIKGLTWVACAPMMERNWLFPPCEVANKTKNTMKSKNKKANKPSNTKKRFIRDFGGGVPEAGCGFAETGGVTGVSGIGF